VVQSKAGARVGGRRRRNIIAVLSVVALAAAAWSSSGGSKGAGATTKSAFDLGCVGDFSGPLGSTGLPLRNGFETYIDSVNRTGGVHGRKIDVTALDDASDVVTAKQNLQQLVSSHTLGAFCGNDDPSAVLAAEASPDKTLQMSISVGDSYTFPPQPYIYRGTFGATGLAEEQIGFTKYLISQHKLPAHPKVALIWLNVSVIQSMDTYLKPQLKQLGWNLVSDQQISLTATAATTQTDSIASSKPDVVFAMIDPSAIFAVTELRQQGYKGPVVEFSGANTPANFQALNDPQYYSLSAFAYPGDSAIPAAVTELKQSKTFDLTQGNNSSVFTLGYVEAMVAVAALTKCGTSCTPVTYNRAMNNIGTVKVNGLAPGISITPRNHQLVNSGQFYVWDTAKNAIVAAGPPIKAPNP
jgi:branched-chain amino acid transport system substrate-binding protein